MLQIDKYTALSIEEYKGVFSLIEGYVNKDGVFKPSWIKEEFGKDKIEKSMPKRVKIGDQSMALRVADAIYDHFNRARPANDLPGLPDFDDPVPF